MSENFRKGETVWHYLSPSTHPNLKEKAKIIDVIKRHGHKYYMLERESLMPTYVSGSVLEKIVEAKKR